MYSAQQLQRSVLESVRRRCANKRNWMAEIARVINKSKHSVYKKYQGEVGLSLQEVLTLSHHYALRIDPLITPDRALSFEFVNPAIQDSPVQLFETIDHQLSRVGGLQALRIRHACIELPFIHDYFFPEITAFKCFAHSHAFSRGIHNRRFSFKAYLGRPDFQKMLSAISRRYYDIPTAEYWSGLMLDITLSQLKYALESGLFENGEEALILCDVVAEYVRHLQIMSEEGVKRDPANGIQYAPFEVYHNEISHSNNVLLVESSTTDYLYLSFGNPHFMFTTDRRAIAFYRDWFEAVDTQSQSLTLHARKPRVRFFNTLNMKVRQVRSEVALFLTKNSI